MEPTVARPPQAELIKPPQTEAKQPAEDGGAFDFEDGPAAGPPTEPQPPAARPPEALPKAPAAPAAPGGPSRPKIVQRAKPKFDLNAEKERMKEQQAREQEKFAGKNLQS